MSFSSGSCGNSYYLGTDDCAIMIDAGVSLRRVRKSMQDNGLDMDKVAGVLVTHDHLDHIRHLGSFCKRLHKPVYATEGLHKALSVHTFTSDVIGPCRRIAPIGEWTMVGKFRVHPFIVPHDATETVGYAIETDGYRFVIMTDLGQITEEALAFAKEASTVVIESNYDVDMLLTGPYTHELKMRIIQGCGHLSNDDCALAVKRIFHPKLRNLFLCHLSGNNNTPQRAYDTTASALNELQVPAGVMSLRCLPRSEPSPLFNLL